MSFDTYYVPWVEKDFYVEGDSIFHDVHPLEKSAYEGGEFESTSDYMTDTSSEIPCSSTETPKAGFDFTLDRLDNIDSSILTEGSHDSILNEHIVDPTDEINSLRKEKSSRTSGHLNDHASEERPVIKFCVKQFPSKCSVNADGSKDRKYVCEQCEKSFSKNQYLKKHLKTHSGMTNFSCKICTMHFRLKSELKRHMLVHSVEKPHACHLCGKLFKMRSLLTRHLSIHTKSRFVCKMCNKQFQSEKHLLEHIVPCSSIRLPVYECLQSEKNPSFEKTWSSFPYHEKQDEKNKTVGSIDWTSSTLNMNSSKVEGRPSLTSTDEICLQSQPSNYLDYTAVFNTESATDVVPTSSRFELASPVDVHTTTPDFCAESPSSRSWNASALSPVQWEETMASIDWTSLTLSMNSSKVEGRPGLTSTDEIYPQSQPSNYLDYTAVFNTESAIHVVPTS